MEQLLLETPVFRPHKLNKIQYVGHLKRTYSKSNDSRWKGKKPILSHAFWKPNEGVCNPKHDPPEKSTKNNSSCPQQKHGIPLKECLNLQTNSLTVPRERWADCRYWFAEYIFRETFIGFTEICRFKSEGTKSSIVLALFRIYQLPGGQCLRNAASRCVVFPRSTNNRGKGIWLRRRE